jgi:hypothetical protein
MNTTTANVAISAKPNSRQLVVHHSPRIEEDHLDVENDEDHRDQVEADREPGSRLVAGDDPRLVRPLLGPGRALWTQKAREPATDPPAKAATTTISNRIGRYCSTGRCYFHPGATASQGGGRPDRRSRLANRVGGGRPNLQFGFPGGSACEPERLDFSYGSVELGVADDPATCWSSEAGPSGAACAYWLASAGHDVILVERKAYPREKTCGDGLTPRSVRQLEDMGLGERTG